MAKLKITLVKSPIACQPKQRKTVHIFSKLKSCKEGKDHENS